MFITALSLLTGILCLNLFTELPGTGLYLGLLSIAAAWSIKSVGPIGKILRYSAIFLLGMCWAQIHASFYLKHVLPEALAGSDITITGHISDVPVADESAQRFIVDIEEFDARGYAGPIPRRVKLGWYYGEPVSAGETWQFSVRLKPPHGFMNPGGFDYEAWLFHHRINATGYVRSSEENRRIEPARLFNVSAIRQKVSDTISSILGNSGFSGFVRALAVGDRSGIETEQWQVLINTGTNHLMAISGLHIGLAAALGYWLCRRLLPVRVMHIMPAQHAALIGATFTALVYATLAGFAIPAQRALLMLICVAGASLFRRTTRPVDVLSVALILVLLWDPAATMSAGFWFSFTAVAVIYYVLSGHRARSRWLKWGGMQIVIAFALFPLSLYLFQQASLISPLANLLLVPYVSLLVVPLVLLGLLLMPLSVTAAAIIYRVADSLFQLIWPALQWLSDIPYAFWAAANPGLGMTLLALTGVAIVLAPGTGYWRIAGIVLMLPSLASSPQPLQHGAYELNVLDVGQGLAVVVRTHGHTLVYDTGARFSDRLDSGKAVLRPFLIHHGIDKVDLLVVSHGDGDHIGGAHSLLAAYPQTPVLGQGIDRLDAMSSSYCQSGQQWIWDGVIFTVLHPDNVTYRSSNNRSCVIRVEADGGSLLLTGDIEKEIENKLLQNQSEALPADILVAPHHGSESSSGRSFIEAVSPKIVIFAAGYRNRYQFPRQKIVQRYAAKQAAMFISGHTGAIKIAVDPQHGISAVESYRARHGKYWNHVLSKLRQDS